MTDPLGSGVGGPNMEGPVPFITTDESGQMTVNNDVMHALSLAKQPVSIVSIVGKYRTGKSYIMNRFFNKNAGFSLGETIQAMTKGIWIWARPHPLEPNRTLILLDTEGLHDVEKGDETHDMKLFSLALLLSNCIAYNAVGALDDVIIQQLHLVTRLTEHIKTKEGDDEVGNHFNKYFPSFFLLLRDFFLEMTLDGKACTPEQYMENALKMRPGRGKKISDYNEPRECIRAYFPVRKCYTLCKPVEDDAKLRHLDKVPEEEIKEEFLVGAKKAIDDILREAKPFTVEGNPINGPRFVELARMYVETMNEDGIPCIANAVELLKNNECQKALDGALSAFVQIMDNNLKDKLPVDNDYLSRVQKTSHTAAVEHYSTSSLFDEEGEFMKILGAKLEEIYQRYVQENNNVSMDKCNQLLAKCFNHVNGNIKAGKYMGKGGYKAYKTDRQQAVITYQKTPHKGPMAENTLNLFLEARQAEENAIINADKALDKKEKELAKEHEERRRQEERAKTAELEQQNLMKDFLRQQNEHSEMVLKLQQDFQERQDKMMEEHSRDMKGKEQEYSRLMAEGLDKQAEQYKTLMNDMRQDRSRLEEQHKEQMNQLQDYKKQHTAMMDEMRKQREVSGKQMDAMQKRMLELQERQKKKSSGCIVM